MDDLQTLVLGDEANMLTVVASLTGCNKWFRVKTLADGRFELTYRASAELIVKRSLEGIVNNSSGGR